MLQVDLVQQSGVLKTAGDGCRLVDGESKTWSKISTFHSFYNVKQNI